MGQLILNIVPLYVLRFCSESINLEAVFLTYPI